jgi:hypothetical protein
VTFILNVLHSDMSILAADRLAIAGRPAAAALDMAVHAGVGSIVQDYQKITLNSNGTLALGIAGQTQEHYYTQLIKHSASIDEGLLIIQKHIAKFLRFYDRINLNTLGSFTVNQGIASFFDQEAAVYFSNAFLFSPVHNQTRLHRGADEVKVFHAGSGGEHFEKTGGLEDIKALIAATKNSRTPEDYIPWMLDAFKKVSASDSNTGAKAVFAVSTRNDPKFRFM